MVTRSRDVDDQGIEHVDAAHHDAHIDDPHEWDTTGAVVVEPKPSGMSVFSLRLPTEEIAALREVASRQGRNHLSELVREAVRAYLNPGGTWAALSIAGGGAVTVWTTTPSWVGGRAHAGEDVHFEMRPPEAEALLPF